MKVDPDGLVVVLMLMTALGFFFGWMFATFRIRWELLDKQKEIINLKKMITYRKDNGLI